MRSVFLVNGGGVGRYVFPLLVHVLLQAPVSKLRHRAPYIAPPVPLSFVARVVRGDRREAPVTTARGTIWEICVNTEPRRVGQPFSLIRGVVDV